MEKKNLLKNIWIGMKVNSVNQLEIPVFHVYKKLQILTFGT